MENQAEFFTAPNGQNQSIDERISCRGGAKNENQYAAKI